MKNNKRIAEIDNNREVTKKKRFTKTELEGWMKQYATRDRTVKPDFLGGVGTASEGYRKAWETRNERSRFLKPWESMDSASEGEYLVPAMAAEFSRYHEELTAFASDPANKQTIEDVLGKSVDDFKSTLDEWKEMAENEVSIMRSAHETLPGQSFAPQQREQAFHELAMMVDRFQYMQWRVNNPDKLMLHLETLNKACKILKESEEGSYEYCRAWFAILDGDVVIKKSHSEVSDSSAVQQKPFEEIEVSGADMIGTTSGNLEPESALEMEPEEGKGKSVAFVDSETSPQIASKETGRGTVIDQLFCLRELEAESKSIPNVKDNIGNNEKYEENCNIENNLNKIIDKARKIIKNININTKKSEKGVQKGVLQEFVMNELVSQTKRLEESLVGRRDALRGILRDQAQGLGQRWSYFLEHQRYEYEPGSDRAVFYQKGPICGKVCVAMLAADQIADQNEDYRDEEKAIAKAEDEIEKIKIQRKEELGGGSSLESELIALNNLLGVSDSNTGKGYVYLTGIKNDELQGFIQASMQNERRGSISVSLSHEQCGSPHGVVIDRESEERFDVRCPAKGPHSSRQDLYFCYSPNQGLVPMATWQEFLADCEKNNKQTGIWRIVPDPSDRVRDKLYYVIAGKEMELVFSNEW